MGRFYREKPDVLTIEVKMVIMYHSITLFVIIKNRVQCFSQLCFYSLQQKEEREREREREVIHL